MRAGRKRLEKTFLSWERRRDAAAGTWLNPSPPGVPLPGSIPPPLPSRKYARRVGTQLRAPPPALLLPPPPGGTSLLLLLAPHAWSAPGPGRGGEKREERQRPQLPECGNRTLQAQSSLLGSQDSLRKPAQVSPPQSHAHPYPREGRVSLDTQHKVFLLPRPTLYIPFQAPALLLSRSDSSPASNFSLNPLRLPDQTSHSPTSFPPPPR